jgi:hypothetical protein
MDIFSLTCTRLKQLRKWKKIYDLGIIDELFLDTMVEVRNRLNLYNGRKKRKVLTSQG